MVRRILISIFIALCALAFLATSSAPPAQARPAMAPDIDFSGFWRLNITGGLNSTCDLTFVQVGGSFTVTGTCSGLGVNFTGTINTTTGDFTATGSAPPCATIILTGTASLDGNSVSGAGVCTDLPISFNFTGTRTVIVIEKVTNPSGGTNFFFNPPQFVTVNSPGGIAGDYLGGGATFGPSLPNAGITGNLELVNDGGGGGTATDGCEPLIGFTPGNIAVIDRGYCPFFIKAQNADDAGAIAVILVNTFDDTIFTMTGPDVPTISSILIGVSDGNTIKGQLPGVNATLHASLGGPFSLDDGETQTYTYVSPGTYKFTEDNPDGGGNGYTVSDISCDDSGSSVPSTADLTTTSATVNVEVGEMVTCTFTNDSAGDIVINKVTDPSGLTGAQFAPTNYLDQYRPVDSRARYEAMGATFGTPLDAFGLFGNLELVDDGTGTTTDACEPLVGFTVGYIALIDSGNCAFDVKVQNAENAGAIAAVIANVNDDTLVLMTGSGPTIPSIFIGKTAGDALQTSLAIPATVTVNLTSPLGGVFNLDDGQMHTVSFVPPGKYQVTETSTGAVDVKLDALGCDDGDSTGDLPNYTATINLAEGETVSCTFTNKKSSATAVNVTNVNAIARADKNILKWQTTSEAQIAGFNIYRKTKNAQWKMLNAQLKQAKHAGDALGDKYRFTDKNVKAGKTYRYKIEVVYLDGHSEWTEIVRIKTR